MTGAAPALLADGISVNFTLIFSVARYRAVADATERIVRSIQPYTPIENNG